MDNPIARRRYGLKMRAWTGIIFRMKTEAKQKILLTGGSGFIGRHVASLLADAGHEVHVPCREPAAVRGADARVRLVAADLFDDGALERLFGEGEYDTCVHLAWYCGPGCHGHAQNAAWVARSIRLLEAFAGAGGKRFVGGGSVAEYDYRYGFLREDTPREGPSIYGRCKNAFGRVAEAYCKATGVSFAWARIFNLYGPWEKPARLMPSVIRAMLRGEDVKVSPCTKIVDYSHVFDTAAALAGLALRGDVQGAYNLCSGEPVRLRRIVEMAAEKTKFRGKILWGALPAAFEEEFVVGDNAKLKAALGWAPKWGLDEGLDQTIEWHRENPNYV